MIYSPPYRRCRTAGSGNWLTLGGAAISLLLMLAPCLRGDEPKVDGPDKALDEAVESLVIDPQFSAELFRDRATPQKVLPDDEEAVAGDGGSMPAVAPEDAVAATDNLDAAISDVADAADGGGVLKAKVRKALGAYFRRNLNTRDHTPWEVFHQIVAYGPETQVRRGGPRGEKVDAVRWLCENKPCRGMQLMHLERGKMALRRAKGVQGHYGQFLAILAQHGIPRAQPIEIEGRKFRVEDLIVTEQRTCRTGEELTFKLIAFAHYLEPGATWKNERGETWSIERVLREEINAPIRGAACGGTHRLMGLSYAVRRRDDLGQPIDGEYLRADKYLRDYHRYTFSLQNDDGSFSTEWFAGRGNREIKDRKLQTTGHITEWLAYSLPQEHLDDPRMAKAIDFLATLLLDDPHAEWKIGPLGHALHALALYDQRVFVPDEAKEKPETVAESPAPALTEKQAAAPPGDQVTPRHDSAPKTNPRETAKRPAKATDATAEDAAAPRK